jgi:hypothetical protein
VNLEGFTPMPMDIWRNVYGGQPIETPNVPHEAMPFYDMPMNVPPSETMAPPFSDQYYQPDFTNPPPAEGGGGYPPSNYYQPDFTNPPPTEGGYGGYPTSDYFPQDYPPDFSGIAPPGIEAPPIPEGAYDLVAPPEVPNIPVEAQQYTLSDIPGFWGDQELLDETGSGVAPAPPEVAAATPVPETQRDPQTGLPVSGDPRQWTQGVIPGTQLSARDLLNMARQPTDWANSPLADLGTFFGKLISEPSYSSPEYLRSIGYQGGQGLGSLWPGGPGAFGEGIATGGESPGDYYRVASAGANVIPFTGGVGGGGGSFFTSTGHGLPAFMPAGAGGGGPVQAGTYTSPAAMAELRRWMQGRYTPPGALKYPSPILVGAASRIRGFGPVFMPSAQQQQALAQQWGNVFRDRGYVLPPTTGGRGGPVPPRPGGRGTPPPLPR